MTTTGVHGIALGAFARFLVHPRAYGGPLAALVVVFLLTLAANHFHLFSGLEHLAGDLTLAVVSAQPPQHVVIVDIDDQMYDREFEGRSPLEPARLAALIRELAAASPRVVVVDVDTAHRDFQSVSEAALLPAPPAVAPAIVWFRDGHATTDDAHGREALTLGGFLGQPNPPRAPGYGVGRFRVDSDGMVRRYPRTFEAAAPAAGQVPSLAWASVLAYCRNQNGEPCTWITDRNQRLEKHEEESDALLVFPRSPLAAALGATSLSRGSRPVRIPARDLAQGPWWHQFVAGKIVVLGGTYEAGRDTHRTAFGDTSGVFLWAASIENELLQRNPVQPYEGLWMKVADVAFALLFMYLNWRWVALRPGTAGNLLLNAGILVVLWVITWRIVNDYSLLVGTVPLIAGVWIHQVYDLAKEGRELRRELDALRHQATAAAPAPPPAPPA